VNLNMKTIKMFCHWFLLLDLFRFCEAHFTAYQRLVASHSAISPFLGGCPNTRVVKCKYFHAHPKTFIEIAMFLSKNSGSFPSDSHVSTTFSILFRFVKFWNPTNCEKFKADGSLMGRTNLDKSVW